MMPFIIDKLGDRWYGIWVILGGIAGYYYLLDFGLASAVSRYVALNIAQNDTKNTNVIINTSLVVYSFLSFSILLISVVIVMFAGYFIGNTADLTLIRIVLIIIGIKLSLEFPFKAFVGIIQAHVRYDLLTYSHYCTLALSTGLIVYFLMQGHGILALAVIGLFSSLISNVLFYSISKYIFPDLTISLQYFKRQRIRELFGYSIWSFVTQIANQLRFRIDSIVLAFLLSTTHVTHYFIGARLVEYFDNLLYRATNMLTPVFTAYYAQNKFEDIRIKLLLLNRINLILGLFGGGLIIILGKAFIQVWMGEKYLDAYPVLVILILAIVVNFVNNPSMSIMYAMSKHQYLAMINIVEGIMNLALSIILIKSYGIIGCALGTAIPLIITRVLVLPVYVRRFTKLSLKKYYFDMLFTALFTICYLGLYYLIVKDFLATPIYSKIIVVALCSLPLYTATIFFIGFNRSERAMMLGLLPKGLSEKLSILKAS
jgi:O-antigen/teichoic acid export membrane protein